MLNRPRWIFAVILILVLFVFLIYFDPFQKITPLLRIGLWFNPNDEIAIEAKRKVAEIRAFSNVEIFAKAAYVFDITDNRIIFAKNENTPFPLASITKLMTALVASEILGDDETVTVSTSSLMKEGKNGLVPNEMWRFEDLRDFTLLVSSNDGASAIARAAAMKMMAVGTSTLETPTETNFADLENMFVGKMNDEAVSLGLFTLNYQNESGLDISSTTVSAVGSAKDVVGLFVYMIKNHRDILEITKYKSFKFTSLSGIPHEVLSTDESINKISHILASKTGFTELAGGSLVVAYDSDFSHPVVIAILGSTRFGRFEDVIALASSTNVYLKRR